MPNEIEEKPINFGKVIVAIIGFNNNNRAKEKEITSKRRINSLLKPFDCLKRALRNKFPTVSIINQAANIIPKNKAPRIMLLNKMIPTRISKKPK